MMGGRVKPCVEHVAEASRNLPAVLDIEVIAHMNELLSLGSKSGNHRRVAVAQTAHADAREEVKVALASAVGEMHAAAGDELNRLAREGGHHIFGF